MNLDHQKISGDERKLSTDPWSVTIDGLVETPVTLDAEDLLRQLGGLEERIYRHRCVEAWAMTVPWTGIALSRLVAFARPTASAKYLRMETFLDPSVAPGQKQDWYPWPYVEGLLAEARTLAFLAQAFTASLCQPKMARLKAGGAMEIWI